MPFKKVGKNDYTGPSGRHFDLNQVRLYYANGGKFPGQKHSEGRMSYAKGGQVYNTNQYAAGGPVLGRTTSFMKVKDEFRDPDEGNASADVDQKYGKSGAGAGKGFVKPPAQRASKVVK